MAKKKKDQYAEGQYGLIGAMDQYQQAREFATVTPLTGIILTKMDGSAKGGIAVAVQSELKIPVKYIGVGEAIEDLQEFDSARFVDALFEMEGASVSDKKLR